MLYFFTDYVLVDFQSGETEIRTGPSGGEWWVQNTEAKTSSITKYYLSECWAFM